MGEMLEQADAAVRSWREAAEAAGPLVDLALRGSLDASLYGELIRSGRVLPWKP
jgi:hypothetical protein